MELQKLLKQSLRALDRNSPTILTGLGVAGLVTTVIFAIKGTLKAQEALYQEAQFRLEAYEEQTGEDRSSYPEEVFNKQEIVELTWRYYIPTAGMGAMTIACMIFANKINLRRNAVLASLYTVAETSMREYQAKVVEQLGEKKEEKIRGEILEERMSKNPDTTNNIVVIENGEHQFYDNFSGRYFKSDIEKVRRLVNDFNQKLIKCAPMFLGINEFYDELGLERIELGDEMGWNAEDNMLEVRFPAKVAPSGVPCVVLDYVVWPKHY